MNPLGSLIHSRTPRPQFPKALEGSGFILAETDVGQFWLPAQDQVMRPYLQRQRTWERSTAQMMRLLLRPGCRFLDVGAGVGYFSVLAAGAHPGITIDSVEPCPDTLDVLRFNLWVNHVDATVWPVALAATRTAVPLSATPTDVGATRTTEARPDRLFPVVVAAISADEAFASRTFDLIKIDVQGAEFEVLLGMQRIIRTSPHLAIVVEYEPGLLRRYERDPLETLADYRRLGFELVLEVEGALKSADDEEVLGICDSAGPGGRVHILLRRR